jgi:hypothetical protein
MIFGNLSWRSLGAVLSSTQPRGEDVRIGQMGLIFRACCPNRPDWKEKSTQAGGDVLTECSHHDGTTEERAAAL